ncbi:DoxX family membrane protein [Flagellimonas onchidii]|uniref:DoxX family membrane protein n=1 Tax=Flagellimonas onchidii TaxID=2562684 RepID=UPI00145623F8|nr:DoxX family membrane protein [Allomuricauda onchidii]
MKTTNKQTAYALLRITMGINLFAHGLVRLPKIAGFRDWMMTQFQHTILPQWSVYAWGSVLPILELLVGGLLILGIFTYRAAIAGALLIAILILGSCLAGHWEWAGGQMVYALFFYFIISNVENNAYALDLKFKIN